MQFVRRLEQAEKPKSEGRKIAVELMQQLAEIDGISGIHLMAYKQEEWVGEIVTRSGVLGARNVVPALRYVAGLDASAPDLEKQVEDGWRSYAYPAQARHLANEVDKLLWEEVFSLALTQSPGNVAVRSKLANFGPAGLGDLDYSAIGFMK